MDALLALDIDEELLATCGALGYTEDDQYYKGEECWECMKDLIGFLKRDTSSCLTRRQLGCTQILQTDILSILVNFWEDENLLNACIKLLVNLTLPAFLCMDSSYPGPKDVQANKIYLELNVRTWFSTKSLTLLLLMFGPLAASLANSFNTSPSFQANQKLIKLIRYGLGTPNEKICPGWNALPAVQKVNFLYSLITI
ncbi:protein timeless homolog isoform X3 [Oscarella lobularis]|uniref:protein timeless homolog isoform X3 n=1 Tax=Oscarella lobularis TaxID=121494 RepID=UPI00331432A5